MSDDIVRIEKLENGYEVEVCSPKISKANASAKPTVVYQSPWKGYAFTTKEEVITFLTKVLDKLSPEVEDDEFGSSFDEAVSTEE
jgi:hypothetical protein